MLKGFKLSVYVGKKVFCALREVQNGLKIDNLCACFCNGGKTVGEEMQIAQIFFHGECACRHKLNRSLVLVGSLLFHGRQEMAQACSPRQDRLSLGVPGKGGRQRGRC